VAAIISGLVIAIIVLVSVFGSHSNSNNVSNSNLQGSANNARSVVNVLCDDGSGGSGTIFTEDGLILTNNHVITNAAFCLVTLPDPATGHAEYIYHAQPLVVPYLSTQYDIAVLSIDSSYTDSDGKTWGDYPTSFPKFTVPDSCGSSTSPQLGDSIRVYGYPVTSGGYNLTVTDGIVSSFTDDSKILTSAKIDNGNSGGLAVDQSSGCFIGIPSAVESGNYQNLGVIIPKSIIKDFLDQISAQSSTLVPPETKDQLCQNDYGINSVWSGRVGRNDQPTCVCRLGYTWNLSGSACATKVSLDQICQDNYGVGSYSYPGNGRGLCGCQSGYTWNSNHTSCVIQESNDQICRDNYGPISVWTGRINSNGSLICGCPTGYTWSADNTACVIDTSRYCNGVRYNACPIGESFFCPPYGVASCYYPDQFTCNGKYFTPCPGGQRFACPAYGDAYCSIY